MRFALESFMSMDNCVIYLRRKSKTNKVYQNSRSLFLSTNQMTLSQYTKNVGK